jgi:hypothetical protein
MRFNLGKYLSFLASTKELNHKEQPGLEDPKPCGSELKWQEFSFSSSVPFYRFFTPGIEGSVPAFHFLNLDHRHPVKTLWLCACRFSRLQDGLSSQA